MSSPRRPTVHLQVKTDKSGRTRSYWAFWRDGSDRKGGRRLGPAHVRDSGRRTPRGAVVWRAGQGSKPSPEYLTPKEAQACLETILQKLRTAAEVASTPEHTLQRAVEGWLAERGLKRSTIASYEDMFIFRDLGADTPVRVLADRRLRTYFAEFKSYRVMSEEKARAALAEGKNADDRALDRAARRQPGDRGGHEGGGSTARGRVARHLEASAARVLSRHAVGCPAPATRLAHYSDGVFAAAGPCGADRSDASIRTARRRVFRRFSHRRRTRREAP